MNWHGRTLGRVSSRGGCGSQDPATRRVFCLFHGRIPHRSESTPAGCCRRSGFRRHDATHSEQPGCAASYSGMESSTEYRRFAQECRRLAQEAKTERHRKIMEEMAQAWDRLAKEAEREGPHAQILPLRFGAPPGLPSETTPAPFATRWPSLSGHGCRSPSPSTPRRKSIFV